MDNNMFTTTQTNENTTCNNTISMLSMNGKILTTIYNINCNAVTKAHTCKIGKLTSKESPDEF
jgi:hypothetical protein